MDASSNYRNALMNMSKVTASFADAMEACSGYVALLSVVDMPSTERDDYD